MRPLVLWFRRDLRLHDHPALVAAIATGRPIAPLFVVDDRLLRGRWPAPNRVWFLRASIAELGRALAERGAPLTVLRGDPTLAVPEFARSLRAEAVAVTGDRASYGRLRDRRVRDALAANDIGWVTSPGLLVQEPEVVRPGGMPYRVFGPFHRAWSALPMRAVEPAPDRIVAATGSATGPGIEAVLAPLEPTADRALLLAPGERAARARLDAWAASPALERYAVDRDRLDLAGTSRLSQDLRWGLLSPVEVAARTAGPGEGRARFRTELAWRDFYAHLLWFEPRVARAAFRPGFETVAWEHDPTVADAWRTGATGYPVVDAAMRQLHSTGWMHNRARMIVASFLTKHLGVDWRVGETHFMAHLVDGDPASNNGGWQWAASTGTDAQPWFRIFNPTLQGRRHDPDGAFVRRWLPELAGIAGPAVHEPSVSGDRAPIVDHAQARARALAAYRDAATLRIDE